MTDEDNIKSLEDLAVLILKDENPEYDAKWIRKQISYLIEKENTFTDNFYLWQKYFPCPKCNQITLDFILMLSCKFPIICTNCKTYFNFSEVNKK